MVIKILGIIKYLWTQIWILRNKENTFFSNNFLLIILIEIKMKELKFDFSVKKEILIDWEIEFSDFLETLFLKKNVKVVLLIFFIFKTRF